MDEKTEETDKVEEGPGFAYATATQKADKEFMESCWGALRSYHSLLTPGRWPEAAKEFELECRLALEAYNRAMSNAETIYHQAEAARKEQIDHYVNLNHPIVLFQIEDGYEVYWVGKIPDLPGCMSHASDPDEAVKSVMQAKRDWIAVTLRGGGEIPLPSEGS